MPKKESSGALPAYSCPCIIIVLMLWVGMACSMAQTIEQPKGISIPLADSDSSFHVLSTEDGYIVLCRQLHATGGQRDKKWELLLLDSTLSVINRRQVAADSEYTLEGIYESSGKLYLLMQTYLRAQNRIGILRISFSQVQQEWFEIGGYMPEYLQHFGVINELMIFGGIQNLRPSVVCYRFGSPSPIILEGLYANNNSLLRIELDEGEGSIIVYFTNDSKKKSASLTARVYDAAGVLQRDIVLQPSKDYHLLSARLVKSEEATVMVGTFGVSRRQLASGIFLARLHSDGSQVINYYDFTRLKHFFDYMAPRQRERMERRIRAKRARGKEGLYATHAVLREMMAVDDGYMLNIECFSQEGAQPGLHDLWSENLKYSHAAVIHFGADALIRSDLVFDLQHQSNNQDRQQLYCVKHPAGLRCVSTKEDSIYIQSTTPQRQGNVQITPSIKLPTGANADWSSHLEHFMHNKLLVYGTVKADGMRRIFFLNTLKIVD